MADHQIKNSTGKTEKGIKFDRTNQLRILGIRRWSETLDTINQIHPVLESLRQSYIAMCYQYARARNVECQNWDSIITSWAAKKAFEDALRIAIAKTQHERKEKQQINAMAFLSLLDALIADVVTSDPRYTFIE